MTRIAPVLALTLALSACATGPVYGPDARAAAEPGAASAAGGESARLPGRAGPGASATTALVAQSRAERDTGDLGSAAATIERALTIAPEDAALWMELAEIRMEQGDWEQAEEMARKALTLTAESSDIGARARRLLAQ
jgi:tetratricopeptide (TPR) repeat protein